MSYKWYWFVPLVNLVYRVNFSFANINNANNLLSCPKRKCTILRSTLIIQLFVTVNFFRTRDIVWCFSFIVVECTFGIFLYLIPFCRLHFRLLLTLSIKSFKSLDLYFYPLFVRALLCCCKIRLSENKISDLFLCYWNA